jgi:hypothetical protein
VWDSDGKSEILNGRHVLATLRDSLPVLFGVRHCLVLVEGVPRRGAMTRNTQHEGDLKGGDCFVKNALVAGAVAGLVGSIVAVLFALLGMSIGLLGALTGSIINALTAATVLSIVFGAIFGSIFSKFHDSVPGKGVRKGLYFGLMLWLMVDICAGAYVGLALLLIPVTIWLIYTGFFFWITYGAVIGGLYKK